MFSSKLFVFYRRRLKAPPVPPSAAAGPSAAAAAGRVPARPATATRETGLDGERATGSRERKTVAACR